MNIQECKALDNYLLQVLSEDGKQEFFDVRSYINLDAFLPLKDLEEFKKIVNGIYFVEWKCGADLSADTIEAKWFDVTDINKKAV